MEKLEDRPSKINFKDLLFKYKSLVGLGVLVLIIGILNPSFFTISNLLNVLRQTSINAIIAAGMTFVILTGGIDLSVGSILAFSGAVAAQLLVSGQNLIIVLIVSLIVGAGIGAINGIIISKGKVQPFIATLVTMTAFRGVTMVFSDGKPISFTNVEGSLAFGSIGGGSILKIPYPVIIMIIIFLVCFYILHQTKIGRYTYALGGNVKR